jgi:hypothetical protein
MNFDNTNTKTYSALTIIEHAAALGYNDLILTQANKSELDKLFRKWSAEWEARRKLNFASEAAKVDAAFGEAA